MEGVEGRGNGVIGVGEGKGEKGEGFSPTIHPNTKYVLFVVNASLSCCKIAGPGLIALLLGFSDCLVIWR